MKIFLGIIMFLLIVLGSVFHLSDGALAMAMVYCGGGGIVLGLIVRALYRSYWKE
jgi:hypothetical protein